ncbi:carboxyl transferase [Nakamurella sp. YIM 132087]|uniref:Carboxyl transferase n=1 Tax=Nakamurella alba TaxID=2665158 RepID=A0A7K1FP95_9ACTN|nr:carboxyl transferase domain-containing protein [Nakamurella alba]MTD15972.1 carboxyl transferase [Nakamurella alba]
MVAEPVVGAPDAVADLHERAARIRDGMGGAAKVAALAAAGRLTARQRIDGLLDDGTFDEIGTFAHSARPEDAASTPGDGKIGGFGRVDGRPVTVVADDITVKRASTSAVGARKMRRLFETAVRDGLPFVFFGETGGARIPDMMGSAGFGAIGPLLYPSGRARSVPMATVIVGESFGASSFLAGVSDLVVQVRGSALAVSSPKVIEVATGERITMEELGGVDVHARTTGQIDLVAEDEQQSWDQVRRFLSYLPSNAQQPPPVLPAVAPEDLGPLTSLVPAERRRAYDARRLVRGIVDAGSLMELQPQFARSLVTGLARIGGHPVGVLASQPLHQAGVLAPQTCDKATRLILLCDAFGLPLVFLHDTPGFVIGRQAEHQRLIAKAMLLQQAVLMAGVPRLSVIVRKSFGLADHVMSGLGTGADLLVAWPGAEISFMDPLAAANVLTPDGAGPAAERVDAGTVGAVTYDTGPYPAAAGMHLDEVIDPERTREVLLCAIERYRLRPFASGADRPLARWPLAW